MNTLEDDLIEAAKLRLLDAAKMASSRPLATMDPELEPMDEEEIQPGVLLSGFYYLPLLVLTRTEDRVRVAPTSPLSSATLPSEARLRWGQGALVFCGWGERECTVADLQPAVWCGSLNEETLGKVRHILETGREKEKLLLPSLQQAAACYKKAASYPWSSCFPAIQAQTTKVESARRLWEVEPEKIQTLQLKANAIKRRSKQPLSPERLLFLQGIEKDAPTMHYTYISLSGKKAISNSKRKSKYAAEDTASKPLKKTYTEPVEDGQLIIYIKEDRLRGKVDLTLLLDGETRKAPLRLTIKTAKGTEYPLELAPNLREIKTFTLDEIGGDYLAFATEELSL